MARLVTCGYESQVVDTTANHAEGQGYLNVGSPVIDTAVQRSGLACLKCTTAGDLSKWSPATALDHWLYLRTYLRVSGNPTANSNVLAFVNTTPASAANVQLVNQGSGTPPKLRLRAKTTTTVGSDSANLVANNWHKVEFAIYVPTSGNGKLYLWLDDTLVASSDSIDVFNVAIGSMQCYLQATPANGVSVFFDDVALNDDTGANQNGRCGEGRIVLLKPIADSVASGFTAGAGGTSNLYQAVDNTPPVGVAAGSATNTSQIKSGISNTTDYYEATLEAYTAYLASTDLVTLIQPLGNFGGDAATVVSGQVSTTANPADGTEAGGNTSGVIGTYPSNWWTNRGPVLYAPSVTLGTSPKVKLRRATSNTTVLHGDALGLYVEYQQVRIVAPPVATVTLAAQAPTVTVSVAPPATTVTDEAQAPSVALSVESPATAITLSALAPTIQVADGVIAPTTAIVVSAPAPALTTSSTLAVPTASITVSAPAPSLGVPVSPPVAGVGGGFQFLPTERPRFDATVQAETAEVFLKARAPAVLVWSREPEPVRPEIPLAQDAFVFVRSAQSRLAAEAPQISAGATISATTVGMQIQAHDPSLRLVSVLPDPQTERERDDMEVLFLASL